MKTKNKFPKYLVEVDREDSKEVTGGGDDLPATPLWVARLRNPFTLALVNATGPRYTNGCPWVDFWPVVVDGDRAKLADKMARALFREYDIYPGDWSAPGFAAGPVEAPEFILMHAGAREFILEPHAPRLWRVRFGTDGQPQSVTHWQGFGIEPEFPRDTRRVADFLSQ
jgi:hypothetical protein